MMALFAGNDSVHARYSDKRQKDGWEPGKKREGSYTTVRGQPITPAIWDEHLTGKRGLVLALATNTGRCRAAGLDIDEYGDDPDFDRDLLNAIRDSMLPAFMHKTKSIGSRVLVFYDDDVDVATSISILRGLQKRLGLDECRCQYFPPVQAPPDENGEPLRQQLNMPYFGEKYPVFRNGSMMEPMSLHEFISSAERERMNASTRASLARLGGPPKAASFGGEAAKKTAAAELQRGQQHASKFLDQYAADLESCPEGPHRYVDRKGEEKERDGRNSVLAAHAHHLGQMVASGWLEDDEVLTRLRDAVQNWGGDTAKTEKTLVRQLARGSKKPHDPLPSGDDDMPKITCWRKIVSDGEEPHWYVTIEGSSRELRITDVRDISDYKRFTNQCIAQANVFFRPVKNAQNKWQEALNNASHLLTEEQAPEDTTPRGRFVELLETYLTNRQRGTKREDLLSGRPWEDEEKGRYEFTMMSLEKFLAREKMTVSTHDCARWIKKLGGGKQNTTIKGRTVNLWFVPSDAFQKMPALAVPDVPKIEV